MQFPGSQILCLIAVGLVCCVKSKPPTYSNTTVIAIPGVDSIDSIEIYNLPRPVYNSRKRIKTFATIDSFPMQSNNMLFSKSGLHSDNIFVILSNLNGKKSIDSFFNKNFDMNPYNYFIVDHMENDRYYASQIEMSNKGYYYQAYKTFPFRDFQVLLYLVVPKHYQVALRDSAIARHAYLKDLEVKLKRKKH